MRSNINCSFRLDLLQNHIKYQIMKKSFLSLSIMMTAMFSTTMFAQFDDLYFSASPEAEFEYNRLNDFEDFGEYYAYGDEAFDNSSAIDEYDEYLAYRASDYEIDAFQYTNRLNNNRFTRFGAGYFGGNALYNPLVFNSFNNFNNGLIGRSAFWGNGFYDPFFGYSNRAFIGNRFIGSGFGAGFGGGFGGFNSGFGGGGFGIGNALYCPPYNATNVQINNFNTNNTRAISSSQGARSTGVTTASTSRNGNTGYINNTSSARSSSNSVRNTNNTRSNVSSSRNTTNSARASSVRSSSPRSSSVGNVRSGGSSGGSSPRSVGSSGGGSPRSGGSSGGSSPRTSPR